VFRRPDGRLVTRDPADVDDVEDVYASVTGDLSAWVAVGFVERRRENRYRVPTTTASSSEPPMGVSFVTADRVDADRLRELDDLLRQDVPGTDGWHWEADDFVLETWASPHFDPDVYVVALDDASGEYIGIARIWMRAAGAHLGFVGVRREFRRRGIAAALLGRVFRTLAARGIHEVTTEIDVTNAASRATIEPFGARVIGESVAVVRHRIR
jgi:RimJ/RimL family protein N-acetyltransferase